MKTCTALAFAGAAAIAAHSAFATNCDFAAIKAKLYPNATEGLSECADETGYDIFAASTFATEQQANDIMMSLACADYYNQINQVANAESQCDVVIEGVTIVFGELIADLLSGKTGNETESASGSDDIEVPSGDASDSEATSGSSDQSDLLTSGSSASKASSSSADTSTNAASSKTIVSVITAGAVAIAGLLL